MKAGKIVSLFLRILVGALVFCIDWFLLFASSFEGGNTGYLVLVFLITTLYVFSWFGFIKSFKEKE